MSRRERILPLLSAGLLLALHAAWLEPMVLYRDNVAEFFTTWNGLLPLLVGVAALIFASTVALGLVVPASAASRVLVLLAALGVLGWLQSAFWSHGYGTFDGRDLERLEQPAWRWADLLVWGAVLVLAWRNHRRLVSWVPTVALALVLSLSVAAFVQGRPDSSLRKSTEAVPDPGLFELSGQRNVFHILLDSFQTDMFLELLEEEGWSDAFDGFTVYRQNMGVARWTSYALPAIFTGTLYDGNEPFEEYYRRALTEGSFHNPLHNAGYRVHLVSQRPMSTSNVTHSYTKSLIYGLRAGDVARREAMQLLDLALFRRVPHGLRGAVHADGNWTLLRAAATPPTADTVHQKAFFNDYVDRIAVATDAPVYHFLHLMPPHPPYATLADGSWAGETLPQTRENYRHEARAILAIYVRLLDRLRALDLYDSSTLLLHGDHGAAFPPRFDGREYPMPQTRVPALLAWKPARATGPVQTNEAPTSLADIPATLMHELKVSSRYPGEPVQTLAETADRTRRFFIVDEANSAQPVLTRFEVQGDVFDPASWREVGSQPVARASRTYEWGTKVSFGLNGNAQPYRGIGWSTPSNAAEWTDGTVAELHFDIEAPQSDVDLELTLKPFLHPTAKPSQRLRLTINDALLGESAFTTDKIIAIRTRIPAQILTGPTMTLRFELPDAASPKTLGVGGDQRSLGVFVFDIRFTEATEP